MAPSLVDSATLLSFWVLAGIDGETVLRCARDVLRLAIETKIRERYARLTSQRFIDAAAFARLLAGATAQEQRDRETWGAGLSIANEFRQLQGHARTCPRAEDGCYTCEEARKYEPTPAGFAALWDARSGARTVKAPDGNAQSCGAS